MIGTWATSPSIAGSPASTAGHVELDGVRTARRWSTPGRSSASDGCRAGRTGRGSRPPGRAQASARRPSRSFACERGAPGRRSRRARPPGRPGRRRRASGEASDEQRWVGRPEHLPKATPRPRSAPPARPEHRVRVGHEAELAIPGVEARAAAGEWNRTWSRPSMRSAIIRSPTRAPGSAGSTTTVAISAFWAAVGDGPRGPDQPVAVPRAPRTPTVPPTRAPGRPAPTPGRSQPTDRSSSTIRPVSGTGPAPPRCGRRSRRRGPDGAGAPTGGRSRGPGGRRRTLASVHASPWRSVGLGAVVVRAQVASRSMTHARRAREGVAAPARRPGRPGSGRRPEPPDEPGLRSGDVARRPRPRSARHAPRRRAAGRRGLQRVERVQRRQQVVARPGEPSERRRDLLLGHRPPVRGEHGIDLVAVRLDPGRAPRGDLARQIRGMPASSPWASSQARTRPRVVSAAVMRALARAARPRARRARPGPTRRSGRRP